MRPDPDTSTATARVRVAAHGWPCVQRIVVLLTSRAYVVRSFEATQAACAPYWQVSICLQCTSAELSLLRIRLERIPAVTTVETAAG